MFGAFLIVAVELALADGGRRLPGAESLVVGYVVLAFLGQAGLGWGLIKGVEGLNIVGWVTIGFNLGALAAVVVVSPNDMYYPRAHMAMPAVIAVALTVKRRSADKKGTLMRSRASDLVMTHNLKNSSHRKRPPRRK